MCGCVYEEEGAGGLAGIEVVVVVVVLGGGWGVEHEEKQPSSVHIISDGWMEEKTSITVPGAWPSWGRRGWTDGKEGESCGSDR